MDRRRAAAALLALAACFGATAGAPTADHTALDLYEGPSEGCYYNFQHYGEGDRIMTNEPCLNCTCHNKMLMCYLRVCPFTKAIGQDCTVEKRADQCCPIVTCPDVPVDLLTSTSTTSPAEYGGTGVGKVDNYGCSINGKYFPEGAKVPPTPNKPCEHCYCIRNMTTCVMQECTLHVDGCTPIYHKDVCCPVRYFCDHPEDEIPLLDDMTTTVRPTQGFLLTTTTEVPVTEAPVKRDCVRNDQVYPDGALIKSEKPCVHCYCMKGDIVCVVHECGTPMENEGKNCTALPPREGQCCPDTYICEGDEVTGADATDYTLHDVVTTVMPIRRKEEEGSGYRKDETPYSEVTTLASELEGSGQEPEIVSPEEQSTPETQTTAKPIDDRFEPDQDLFTTLSSVEEEKTTPSDHYHMNTVEEEFDPTDTKLTTPKGEEPEGTEEPLEQVTVKSETSSEPAVSDRVEIESDSRATESTYGIDELPTTSSSLEHVSDSHITEEAVRVTEPSDVYGESSPTTGDSQESMPKITTVIEESHSTEKSISDESTTPSSIIDHEASEQTIPDITTSKYDLSTEVDSSKITDLEQQPHVSPDRDEIQSTHRPTEEHMAIDTTSYKEEENVQPEITTAGYKLDTTESPLISEQNTIPSEDESQKPLSELTTSRYDEPALSEITTSKQEEPPLSERTTLKYAEPELFDKTTLGYDEPSMISKTTLAYEEPLSSEKTTIRYEEPLSSEKTTIRYEEPLSPEKTTIRYEEPSLLDKTTSKYDEPSSPELTTLAYIEPSIPEKTTTVYDEHLSDKTTLSHEEPSSSETTTLIYEKPSPSEQTTTKYNEPELSEKTTSRHEEPSLPEITTLAYEEPPVQEKTTSRPDAVAQGETTEPTKLVSDSVVEVTEPESIVDDKLTTSHEQYVTTEQTDRIHDDGEKPTYVTEKEEVVKETSTASNVVSEESLSTGRDHLPTTHILETQTESVTEVSDIAKVTTGYETELVSTTLSDKQEVPDITHPDENEISPPGRIPGEGDCLSNGVTYRNDTSVPSTNKCQSNCKCISSIIKCDPIICSPQPEYMDNCKPVYDTPDSCCPTYICDHTKETVPPESHSQMSGTDRPISSPSIPIECTGDTCEVSAEQQPSTTSSPKCTSESCLGETDATPTQDCGPEGCNEIIQKPIGSDLCEGGKCQLPEKDHAIPTQSCDNPEECKIVKIPDTGASLPCEGDSCVSPIQPTEVKEPCTDESGCKQSLPETPVPTCEGESCAQPACDKESGCASPCQGDNCDVNAAPETCEGQDNCKSPIIPGTFVPPCEGDSCVEPQSSIEKEKCTEENGCKKPDENVPEICEGENCQQKPTDLSNELPTAECKDSECQQKPKPSIPDIHTSTETSIKEQTPYDSVTDAEPDVHKQEDQFTTSSPELSSHEVSTVLPKEKIEPETDSPSRYGDVTESVYEQDETSTKIPVVISDIEHETSSPEVTQTPPIIPTEQEELHKDVTTDSPHSTSQATVSPTEMSQKPESVTTVEEKDIPTESPISITEIHEDKTQDKLTTISDTISDDTDKYTESPELDVTETEEYKPTESSEVIQPETKLPHTTSLYVTETEIRTEKPEIITTILEASSESGIKITEPELYESGSTQPQQYTTEQSATESQEHAVEPDINTEEPLSASVVPEDKDTHVPETPDIKIQTEASVPQKPVTDFVAEQTTQIPSRLTTEVTDVEKDTITDLPEMHATIQPETETKTVEPQTTVAHEEDNLDKKTTLAVPDLVPDLFDTQPDEQVTKSPDIPTDNEQIPLQTDTPLQPHETETGYPQIPTKKPEPTVFDEDEITETSVSHVTEPQEIATDSPSRVTEQQSVTDAIESITDIQEQQPELPKSTETPLSLVTGLDTKIHEPVDETVTSSDETKTEAGPAVATEQPVIISSHPEPAHTVTESYPVHSGVSSEIPVSIGPIDEIPEQQITQAPDQTDEDIHTEPPVTVSSEPTVEDKTTAKPDDIHIIDTEKQDKTTEVPTPTDSQDMVTKISPTTEEVPTSLGEEMIETTKLPDSPTTQAATEPSIIKQETEVPSVDDHEIPDSQTEREPSSESITTLRPEYVTTASEAHQESVTEPSLTGEKELISTETPSSDISTESHKLVTDKSEPTDEGSTTHVPEADIEQPSSQKPEIGKPEPSEQELATTEAPLSDITTHSHETKPVDETPIVEEAPIEKPAPESTTSVHDAITEISTIGEKEELSTQSPSVELTKPTEESVHDAITEISAVGEKEEISTQSPAAEITKPTEESITKEKPESDVISTIEPSKDSETMLETSTLSQTSIHVEPELTTTAEKIYTPEEELPVSVETESDKTTSAVTEADKTITEKTPETGTSELTESTKLPESTEAIKLPVEESTGLPSEEDTKPSQQPEVYSETTPYLIELEEHPHHEISSTEIPADELTTAHKETISDVETPKPVSEIHTEGPSKTDTYQSTSTERYIPEISSEHATTVQESETESPKPEIQTDNRFDTEPQKDYEKVTTTLPTQFSEDDKQTTLGAALETSKPFTTAMPEQYSERDIISSTTKAPETETTYEPTSPEEQFIPAKVTTEKTDEEIATQPPTFDKTPKPEERPSEVPTTEPEVTKPGTALGELPSEELPSQEEEGPFPSGAGYGQGSDYEDEDQAFGPGTCRYGGKVYVSAQQIPRDDPCDFCFCFRSDIICLQQSCPPPIHGCHEEPIQGFCCPRYECPVSMATSLNVTTTSTTTTTTLPPHFLPHAYKGAAQRRGCQIKGHTYKVGEVVRASSGPCLHCTCGGDGQMKCDPKACTPEPMLRQMIAAAVSAKRRR